MLKREPFSKQSTIRHVVVLTAWWLGICSFAAADDIPALMADRMAIEKVYYDHRLGTKPPFEQTLPPAQLEQMISLDRKKEAILKSVYGETVSSADLEAELNRIDAGTRAPETLTEIKSALSNDLVRIYRSLIKPILVERKLRAHFERDAPLHRTARQQAEQVRAKLLAWREIKRDWKEQPAELQEKLKIQPQEITWQLIPRSEGEKEDSNRRMPTEATECKAQGGVYSFEAKAQIAQVLTSEEERNEQEKLYFEELPDELRNVLNIQLRKAGDVSAVIELSTGFLVYWTRERTARTLSVTCFPVAKISYDDWLASRDHPDKNR